MPGRRRRQGADRQLVRGLFMHKSTAAVKPRRGRAGARNCGRREFLNLLFFLH
jgi:hypothetical protein